jgi:hypothetical protein
MPLVVPSPDELVWLVDQGDSLGPAPYRQVLAYFMNAEDAVDVSCPVVIL